MITKQTFVWSLTSSSFWVRNDKRSRENHFRRATVLKQNQRLVLSSLKNKSSTVWICLHVANREKHATFPTFKIFRWSLRVPRKYGQAGDTKPVSNIEQRYETSRLYISFFSNGWQMHFWFIRNMISSFPTKIFQKVRNLIRLGTTILKQRYWYPSCIWYKPAKVSRNETLFWGRERIHGNHRRKIFYCYTKGPRGPSPVILVACRELEKILNIYIGLELYNHYVFLEQYIIFKFSEPRLLV